MTVLAEAPSRNAQEREYGISFVAQVFGKSVHWVRWCENDGRFKYLDGTLIMPRRTQPPRARIGFRKYTLDQISDMADALHRSSAGRMKLSDEEYTAIKQQVESLRVTQ